MGYPDPALRERVYPLLDLVWPGFVTNIRRAEALGWPWTEVSTPFVVEEGGEIVSHVGVLAYDALVDGVRRPIAGVHAVCTHPGHRRRGHARRALKAALAHVDALGVPAVLATGVPEVYAPHGFEVAAEQRWRLPAHPGGSRSARPLDAADPADVARLVDLLERRTPLSRRMASLAPPWMFGICEVLESGDLSGAHHAPDLDAILVWEGDGGGLVLIDVIAGTLPPLDAVLDHLPPASHVDLAFAPDRFAPAAGHPIPAPADDLWMVRGLPLPAGPWQMPLRYRH